MPVAKSKRTAPGEIDLGGFTARDILKMPHIFGRYLGYDKLQPIHGEWIRDIWLSEEHVALQAHRKAYKTTAIIVVGIIWYLLFNPEHRILIARKGKDDAASILGEIARHYKGEAMRTIYRLLYGITDFRLTVERSDRITLPTKTKTTKEGSIEVCGVDASVTGRHYERIHTDDIITIKDRISRAHREATKVFIRELDNIINFGGVISHTGTPWHKDDGWSLMPPPARYPLGTIQLPELTDKVIAEIRSKTLPSLFAINYELRHVADEDAIFKDINLRAHPVGLEYSAAHLDAAYGGDNTTALTILGQQDDKLYLRGWCWHQSVEDVYGDIVEALRAAGMPILHVETNADKGMAAKELRRRGVMVNDYAEKENKHIKIVAHLYRNWARCFFHPDSDPDYLSQINEYRQGQDLDDAPDSAASLIREAVANAYQGTGGEDYAGDVVDALYATRRR